MARDVWVARLSISSGVAEKLAERHDLDADDVRLHVQEVSGLSGSWDYHPERGSRLLLKVPMDGRMILVVLYPRSEGDEDWNLGSAYAI